ncbi:hypothetical protein G4B88_023759, partial [Cannabis sativa]
VREKDVCWEYAEKLDGNKVRCKFCMRVLNGGISRLKHHLSRLPSKGVNPCSKVRDDVTDRVRAIIASKEDVKETSSTKKQKLVEVKSPVSVSGSKALVVTDVSSPVAKVFPTVTPMANLPSNNQDNAERSIALFFFENKLDFSIARSSSYQMMIDAITKCGPGFLGPSAETLKTTCPEFCTSSSYLNKQQSLSCIAILEDNEFWRAVDECVAISEPFLKVLREVSGGKPAATGMFGCSLAMEARDVVSPEWVEESDNSSPSQWLDRFGPLDGNDLNTRQFSAAIFNSNDPIFGL